MSILKKRWNEGTAEDRFMPTARVTDLPVMSPLKRDGQSALPLEPDRAELAFDERHMARVLHYNLVTGNV